MKKIAIITARGGSKRIPKKNIKLFSGHPILKYSIDAALAAECFDEIMVSTDDFEIAKLAKELGANVPFLRSKKNSDDFSTTADVICEVIKEYQNIGITYDYLCCIYPTAPFVTSSKLKAANDLLIKTDADCVMPVVQYSYPIQRSLKIEDGKIKMNWPENYLLRSQDLTATYHDCGQYYFMKTESLLVQKRLFTENTIPIITSDLEAQDIDTEDDWKIAEMKYTLMVSKQSAP